MMYSRVAVNGGNYTLISSYYEYSRISHVVQEAEKRTRALSAQESEMAQARADIQHERERLAEEVDSRARRSREECDYKVDLER